MNFEGQEEEEDDGPVEPLGVVDEFLVLLGEAHYLPASLDGEGYALRLDRQVVQQGRHEEEGHYHRDAEVDDDYSREVGQYLFLLLWQEEDYGE